MSERGRPRICKPGYADLSRKLCASGTSSPYLVTLRYYYRQRGSYSLYQAKIRQFIGLVCAKVFIVKLTVMLHNRGRRRSRVCVSSLKGLPMFTVSDLSLIQWPSRSGLASLRAGLSAVPRSAQTEVARSDISSLTGRLPSLGLSAAARIAKGGAETARTAESPRACQPRDGPETSDADSATGPPADSLGPATVLALPARALPRPAKPTAAA